MALKWHKKKTIAGQLWRKPHFDISSSGAQKPDIPVSGLVVKMVEPWPWNDQRTFSGNFRGSLPHQTMAGKGFSGGIICKQWIFTIAMVDCQLG